MLNQRPGTWLAAGLLVAALAGTARAKEPEHKRVTVAISAVYLLVPVYQLNAELALRPRWSVALRGGAGQFEMYGQTAWISELGAQAAYYLWGHASRGFQVGLDTRLVGYDGDGMLLGLGDGLAVGAFAGYKRAFGPGFTLGVQLGAAVAVAGESEDPVFPFLAVTAGWSFWRAGGSPTASTQTSVAASTPPASRDPFDYHRGFLIGFSLGGGAVTTEGCDSCEMRPGLAVDASMGWFLSRRFALLYDTNGLVGILSSGFGSTAVVLQAAAVQYWPHRDVWLKLGIGVGRRLESTLLQEPTDEWGGGGTFAAGYEFHHDGRFNMDFHLRATHVSFDKEGGGTYGVNTFIGVVGFHWY